MPRQTERTLVANATSVLQLSVHITFMRVKRLAACKCAAQDPTVELLAGCISCKACRLMRQAKQYVCRHAAQAAPPLLLSVQVGVLRYGVRMMHTRYALLHLRTTRHRAQTHSTTLHLRCATTLLWSYLRCAVMVCCITTAHDIPA